MKKIMLAICCVISFSGVTAQTIIKILLIGDKGPTNEKKEANSFIAVKNIRMAAFSYWIIKCRGR
ncbi:MAG: hypothetical protein IPH68_05330 [Chitinophagaceae bacterium]|nr:hypothetical protein [Chitinophagaceae bacterium]